MPRTIPYDHIDDSQYSGPERRRKAQVVVEEPWIRFIAKFGLGAALAVFLVYQLTVNIQKNIDDTQRQVTSHKESAERFQEHQQRAMQLIININTQQCINAALTSAKRDACFATLNGAAPVKDPR